MKDTNPKSVFGIAKPSPGLVPPSAVLNLALAFRDGARKYGAYNWRKDPVSATTYIDAAYRHLMCWSDGEERAQDSGVHHLAHAMACMAILIDAQAQGTLVDDRPTPGTAPEIIKAETKPIETRPPEPQVQGTKHPEQEAPGQIVWVYG